MESLRKDEGGSDSRPEGRIVSRTRRASAATVRSLFAAFGPPRTFWSSPGEPTVAGCGAAVTLVETGPDRFASLTSAVERLFDEVDHGGPAAARPRLLGGLSFHPDHRSVGPWEGFPAAWFVLPRVQLTRTDGDTWLTVTSYGPIADPDAVERDLDRIVDTLAGTDGPDPRPPPAVVDRTRTTDRADWRAQVEAVLDRIERSPLSKAVLAQGLSVSLDGPFSAPDTLERLGTAYPDCHRFLFSPTGAGTFLGATPERLVSLAGRSIETEALAGSTGRGETVTEDDWLEAELRSSEKDRFEHDLVVEAIRDQLAPSTTTLSTDDLRIRQLPSVKHLETPITATLAVDRHVLELVAALHPTPAVGGLPPALAGETIREVETFDRGWYASPVGWIDAAGDGTFAIGIRSAVVRGTAATLFAGAGLVADSVPEREWDEVQLKYRPILDALERP